MKLNEILDRIKERKSFGIIIILLAAGLIFVIVSTGRSAKKSDSALVASDNTFDFYEYETQLEKRLEEKIDKISGVDGCDVILLVETSYRYDYLCETGGKTITGKIDGIESVLTESENAPVIRGVAVICKGGDDPVVQRNIMDMLSALLGLPSNKIWVGSR